MEARDAADTRRQVPCVAPAVEPDPEQSGVARAERVRVELVTHVGHLGGGEVEGGAGLGRPDAYWTQLFSGSVSSSMPTGSGSGTGLPKGTVRDSS